MRGEAHPLRLRHKVIEAIAHHGLWARGETVVVGVSGGADSVALLDLLVASAGAHQGALRVATVDHGVREGSAQDADFVEALSAGYGLPCHRFALALGDGASEDQMRKARREGLASLGHPVALAHHRDDQAETVLLQLLRGAGRRGLAGMLPRHGPFVRPLLAVTRAELRRWLDHRGLSWREDPTNAAPTALRNRVRAELMPLLEALRPGASATVARAAGHLARDEAWLSAQAEAVPGPPFSRDALLHLPPPVLRRVILRLSSEPESGWADEVEAALLAGAPSVRLPGRRRLRVSGGDVIVEGDGPAPGA